MVIVAAALVVFALAGCGPPPAPPPPRRPQKVLAILDKLEDDFQGVPTRWERLSSANFTISFLKYSGVARLVLDTAEEVRTAQLKAWKMPAVRWSPRCGIFFYPTKQIMDRMTAGTTKHGSAQAPASRLVKGQLRYRKIHVAADDRGIIDNTVPHEISHLLVAELMAPKSAPLWADEGLAMQTESGQHQVRRAWSLRALLDGGTSPFPLSRLFAMKRYPDNTRLFYAQSFLLMKVLLKFLFL